MASLQAKFDRFTLHNVLRYLAKSSATGRLTVQSNNGHETQVYLERGKVVHHDMPEAGVAGMTELLTWQKGAFYFEEGKSAPKKTLRLFLDNVLSEEITPDSNNADVSTLGVILRPSTVLTAEGNMELATGTIALDVFAIELLMHFDGQRTLREVAEVVSKPLEQVISASRLLLAKGIAQPLDEATPKPHQHTSSPEQSPTRQPPTEQQTADPRLLIVLLIHVLLIKTRLSRERTRVQVVQQVVQVINPQLMHPAHLPAANALTHLHHVHARRKTQRRIVTAVVATQVVAT